MLRNSDCGAPGARIERNFEQQSLKNSSFRFAVCIANIETTETGGIQACYWLTRLLLDALSLPTWPRPRSPLFVPTAASTRSANRRRTTPTGVDNGPVSKAEGRYNRHRPGQQRLPSSSSSSSQLVGTLRGGWLGVDLIQEIAKAYLAPPSAGAGDSSTAAAGGGGRGAGGQKGSGGGAGSESTATTEPPTKASSERGGGDAGATTPGAGRRAEDRKNSRATRGVLSGSSEGGGRRGDGKDGGGVGGGESGGGRSGGAQGRMGRFRSALKHQVRVLPCVTGCHGLLLPPLLLLSLLVRLCRILNEKQQKQWYQRQDFSVAINASRSDCMPARARRPLRSLYPHLSTWIFSMKVNVRRHVLLS